MIDFYLGWAAALLVTVACCVGCLWLAFDAGIEWKRQQMERRGPDSKGSDNWRWMIGLAVVLELGLLLYFRYT